MRVIPTAAEVAAQESRDGEAEGEVLSEGEFTLKFSILTFGDIQNQSTLRSPAQALPFQGADLDLSHVAGPPPATSPSTLLLPVPPTPPCWASPWLPFQQPLDAALPSPAPRLPRSTLRSARARAESPSLVHPSSTCWAPLSAGAAGQPGCRGKGTASCLGTPQGRCHDGTAGLCTGLFRLPTLTSTWARLHRAPRTTPGPRQEPQHQRRGRNVLGAGKRAGPCPRGRGEKSPRASQRKAQSDTRVHLDDGCTRWGQPG